MKIYAGDRPDETLTFQKPKVVDSEGTPVKDQPELNYTHTSDKSNLVELTDNGDGTVKFHYGTPVQLEDGSFDICEVRSESQTITLEDGSTLKDVKTEQIQLLPGKAAGFAGGGFQFAPDVPVGGGTEASTGAGGTAAV